MNHFCSQITEVGVNMSILTQNFYTVIYLYIQLCYIFYTLKIQYLNTIGINYLISFHKSSNIYN